MPRCGTIWLESIGKLFDVHGHPPNMTTGQLLIPSLRCWVHPEANFLKSLSVLAVLVVQKNLKVLRRSLPHGSKLCNFQNVHGI